MTSSASTQLSQLATFPPELSDYLIDHVQHSKPTLARCSLVCRTWLARSRFHLFKAVTVVHPVCLDDLVAFLRSSPHLASLIIQLTLQGSLSSDSIHYSSQFRVSVETLSNCLNEMPSVRELSLNGVWWTDATAPTPPFRKHLTHSLERLRLSRVFVSPDALFSTLAHFPELCSLRTEGIYWTAGGERTDDINCSAAASTALQSVAVGPGCSYTMMKHFLPRLQQMFDVSAIQHLTLHFNHLDPSEETARFLDSARSHLKSLKITFDDNTLINPVLAESFIDTLRLELCDSLVDFEIALPGDFSRAMQPALAWSLLGSLVSKIPQSVERLTITHRLDLQTLQLGLCNWEWSSLDCALSTKPLAAVVIRSATGGSIPEAEMLCLFDAEEAFLFWRQYIKRSELFFRSSLPKLAEKELLSLEFC